MNNWYNEFRNNCPSVPCILIGNKIDLDRKAIERKYNLADKIKCPFYLVSAADGTNVVRVISFLLKQQIFEDLITMGVGYKQNPKQDYFDKIMDLLDDVRLSFF